MEAIFAYKDNTRRVVRLDRDFFTSSTVGIGKKQVILSPTMKAESLAESMGRNPHVITVRDSGVELIKIIKKENAPFVPFQKEVYKCSPKELKHLKSQFKSKPKLIATTCAQLKK